MATGDETQAGPRPSLPPRRHGDLSGASDDGVFAAQEPLERFGAPQQTTDFGGYDTGPANTNYPPRDSGVPKPQILAPQANEWETNQQEVEVVKSRRTGLILLFILALLVVALIALGLAALSVFNGGDPLPEASTEAGTATEGDETDAVTEQTIETTIPVETTIDPNLLDVTLIEQPFICDNGTREFASLAGATPSEEVAFSSPQTANLKSGMAGPDGTLPIRWSCAPDQAGTTWELTATGAISGKTVTFIFSGALAAEGTTPSTEAGAAPAPAGELTIDLIENPFVCNGETRIFGGLTGADPGEEIAFTSPQASGIKNGVADEAGDLDIRWSCDPDQAGTTWELTATGVTSGRATTVSFTGS